jgi:CRISPR system Cascade subunit CasE
MMYFSKLQLKRNDLDTQRLAAEVCQNSYRPHQLLWKVFATPSQTQRNFLYRQEDSNQWPVFYVVSEHSPRHDETLWDVHSKPYAPKLKQGQMLAFSLRANPVIARKDDHGNTRRHDIVMDLKKRIGYQQMADKDKPPLTELSQQAGIEWLARRSEARGFQFDPKAVRVDGYQQHQNFKRRAKHPIKYSTLDFTGVLTIQNPIEFEHTLFNGIGPAKGFGCGLLLVRRI